MENLIGYYFDDVSPDAGNAVLALTGSQFQPAKHEEKFSNLNTGNGFEPTHVSRFDTLVSSGNGIEVFCSREVGRCRINVMAASAPMVRDAMGTAPIGAMWDYFAPAEVYASASTGIKYPFFGKRTYICK